MGLLDGFIDAVSSASKGITPQVPARAPAPPPPAAPPKVKAAPAAVPPPQPEPDIEIDREKRKRDAAAAAIRKWDSVYKASGPVEKKDHWWQWGHDNILPGQLPNDKPRLALGREAPEIASDD